MTRRASAELLEGPSRRATRPLRVSFTRQRLRILDLGAKTRTRVANVFCSSSVLLAARFCCVVGYVLSVVFSSLLLLVVVVMVVIVVDIVFGHAVLLFLLLLLLLWLLVLFCYCVVCVLFEVPC